MKKVLWIGLVASDYIYQELMQKGYFHFAAQTAQCNLINGIEEVMSEPVDIISGFMMPTYPSTKELILAPYTWCSERGGKGVSVRNLNIRYVDAMYRIIQMKKACIEWAKQHVEDDITIFVYSAVNAYLKGALEIKKICKRVKIYLIITDLPQFMELRPSRLKKILKDLDWRSLNNSIHQCDGWIPFTEHMISYLQLSREKCLVMEGSVDIKNIQSLTTEEQLDKTIVMYSGSLGLQYGVPELLQAFEGISDDNYELWFTGKGNATDLINSKAEQDKRIKNWGFLPTRESLLALQQKATMLINTRMPTEKASAYCFPSKLFEYMLSGKPVLSFRIKGIPDEYYEYLVEIAEVSPECIRETIQKIGTRSKEERKYIGAKGRDFVINNKNYLSQAMRICKFVGLL